MKKEILAKKLRENLERRKISNRSIKSPSIIAIETCFKGLSVSLYQDGKIVTEVEEKGQMQSSRLSEMVAGLLQKEKNVDLMLANKGPGAFTGLRVGVSFAEGFCFGGGVGKLLFCTSFVAMLGSVKEDIPNSTLVIVKAIRDTFYISEFSDKKFGEAKYVTLRELEDLLEQKTFNIICEDNIYNFKGNIIKADAEINSESILKAYFLYEGLFVSNCDPLYIRSSV